MPRRSRPSTPRTPCGGDVPTDTTSRGRAEIEALAAGLFKTGDDVRLEVTDGFVGEKWAVVEWTFSGIHQVTGSEVTFRGASVLGWRMV